MLTMVQTPYSDSGELNVRLSMIKMDFFLGANNKNTVNSLLTGLFEKFIMPYKRITQFN